MYMDHICLPDISLAGSDDLNLGQITNSWHLFCGFVCIFVYNPLDLQWLSGLFCWISLHLILFIFGSVSKSNHCLRVWSPVSIFIGIVNLKFHLYCQSSFHLQHWACQSLILQQFVRLSKVYGFLKFIPTQTPVTLPKHLEFKRVLEKLG